MAAAVDEQQPAVTLTQNPNPQESSQKRPLDDNSKIQNSNYFKIRAVLGDLRPHFLEVLRTPDFQKSKAACEIDQQMKLLMGLYKEMTARTITLGKCQNAAESHPLPGEIKIEDQQKPTEDLKKPTEEQPSLEKMAFKKPIEEKPAVSIPQKSLFDDVQMKGTCIVGGSAFGWNFITFPGTTMEYYGRTKEDFRAANVIPS